MKSILAAATILSALAVAAPARADLILVAAPGPGVDPTQIIVNQPTELDVVGQGSVAGERVFSSAGGAAFIGSPFTNLTVNLASFPTADLTTDPVLIMFHFTPTATGSYQFSGFGVSFTTNDATYSNLSFGPLDFTVVSAVVAAPEPSTLAVLGIAGAMLMGARVSSRDRRSAE